jgi:hypothetical protein
MYWHDDRLQTTRWPSSMMYRPDPERAAFSLLDLRRQLTEEAACARETAAARTRESGSARRRKRAAVTS